MSWKEALTEKLNAYAGSEFDYIETNSISDASKIDLGCTGIYMEATSIYFEIKNLTHILRENGRRKTAQVYTMFKEVLAAISEQNGGFVNCFSPNAFLIVYPGKEETLKYATEDAMKIASAISEKYKSQFSIITGLEFAMGIDHGHLMGSKNMEDNGNERITWFGTSVYKAMRISKECARPFYIGISGSVYHNLPDELRTTTRRILGIRKSIEMWTKVTYQYENVKKHLYQTNHKISLDEA